MESREHLFVTCKKAKDVRNVIKVWWDFILENCNNVEEMLITTGNNDRRGKLSYIAMEEIFDDKEVNSLSNCEQHPSFGFSLVS